MQDAATQTAKTTSLKEHEDSNRADQTTALARCYGKIGISAVAAAAHYQGDAKNLAYAPACKA